MHAGVLASTSWCGLTGEIANGAKTDRGGAPRGHCVSRSSAWMEPLSPCVVFGVGQDVFACSSYDDRIRSIPVSA
jgi:hypothetical protein